MEESAVGGSASGVAERLAFRVRDWEDKFDSIEDKLCVDRVQVQGAVRSLRGIRCALKLNSYIGF